LEAYLEAINMLYSHTIKLDDHEDAKQAF